MLLFFFVLGGGGWLRGLITGGMVGWLLQAKLVAIAFPRAFRMATIMSGRLFLVNESAPWCFVETGLVVTDIVGVFSLSFCQATISLGLWYVDSLLSSWVLMICYSLVCSCNLLDHAVILIHFLFLFVLQNVIICIITFTSYLMKR